MAESSHDENGNGPGTSQGLESIALVGEENGEFGFQLTGNRTMGVFIKSIYAGSTVDKDNRFQTGDQLIKVDDVNLVGLTTDQVARVLRLSLQIHEKADVLVVHEWGRTRGHPYRPETPMSSSYSDSCLAKEVRRKSLATSSEQNNNLLLDLDDKSSFSISAQIHSDSSSSSGEIQSGAVPKRSVTKDILSSIDEENGNGVADSPLPNVPKPSTTSVGKPGKTSPLTPATKATFKNKSRGKKTKKEDVLNGGRRERKTNSAARVQPEETAMRQAHFSPKHHPFMPSEGESETEQSGMGCSRKDPSPDFTQTTVVDRNSTGSNGSDEDGFLSSRSSKNDRSRSASPTGIRSLIHSAQRKSGRKREVPNESLPLMKFDQLNKDVGGVADYGTTPISTPTREEYDRSGSSSQQSSNGSTHITWQCPICFDSAQRIEKTSRRLMSTACGHVFCSECVADIAIKRRPCPTCRSIVRQEGIHPIYM